METQNQTQTQQVKQAYKDLNTRIEAKKKLLEQRLPTPEHKPPESQNTYY